MVGSHHRLNGHESEQALGACAGHGSPACCSSRGCKELSKTEQLNDNKINHCNLQGIYKEPASDLCTFHIGSPICAATSHSRHHTPCAEKQTSVPRAPCLEPSADGWSDFLAQVGLLPEPACALRTSSLPSGMHHPSSQYLHNSPSSQKDPK